MSTDFISRVIEDMREDYIRLADTIWGYSELGYTERKSARDHADALEKAGFRVQLGVAGIPTAIVAEAGSGKPVIGFLGEYDALANLNQVSMSETRDPLNAADNDNGHGCGHHLLGTAAHLAAVAAKKFLEEHNLPGTVRFYGCPAEEDGNGKTFMVREGLLDDVDSALTWHPMVVNGVWTDTALARKQVDIRFKGVSAHAGASPHLGRSALDALELMNIGVNFLREHIIDDARVHYAITDAGGTAANVVQASAAGTYMMRGPDNDIVEDLFERVINIARGAALMTDCEMEFAVVTACSNLIRNETLLKLMQRNMESIGLPDYTNEELSYAEIMYQTTTKAERAEATRFARGAAPNSTPIYRGIVPLHLDERIMHGSTDVGDVSYVTPTVQCLTACYAFGTSPHSWQWVAQGKTTYAHKGMLLAAKTMAATAADLFADPSLVDAARNEFLNDRRPLPYKSPLPADLPPPVPAE